VRQGYATCGSGGLPLLPDVLNVVYAIQGERPSQTESARERERGGGAGAGRGGGGTGNKVLSASRKLERGFMI